MLTKQLNKPLRSRTGPDDMWKIQGLLSYPCRNITPFSGVLIALASSVQLPHSVTMDTKQLKTLAFSASILRGTDQLCVLHPRILLSWTRGRTVPLNQQNGGRNPSSFQTRLITQETQLTRINVQTQGCFLNWCSWGLLIPIISHYHLLACR